jgi:hypothetical protein
VSNSSFDHSDFHHPDGRGQQTRVVYLTGPGRRAGIITKVLAGLAVIAVVAVIASFALVFAAIFAAALLVLILVGTVRHLWRSVTGRPTGNSDDSGIKFSGRIVVTSTGPVVRKTSTATGTVIDVSSAEPARLLTDESRSRG